MCYNYVERMMIMLSAKELDERLKRFNPDSEEPDIDLEKEARELEETLSSLIS